MSEKALQIAVKRGEVKSKGEKERYKDLNADSYILYLFYSTEQEEEIRKPSSAISAKK